MRSVQGTPHNGTDTSRAAAASVRFQAPADREAVMRVVVAAGRRGATCDECEVVTGLLHQNCSARVRDLVLSGYIEDSGQRRPTRTGRAARVYVVTTSGHLDWLLGR